MDYARLHADILSKGTFCELILDSALEGIFTITPEKIITSWSRGAERIYGYTRAEIVGKPVTMLIPPEKAEETPHLMNQIMGGTKIENMETQRLTKDGKRIDMLVTIAPIYSDGKVIGATSFHKDISLRKEAERRYQTLFEQASDAIFIADLSGKYTEVNAAATKMLGYSREELIGKSILDLIPPGDAHKLDKSKELMLQTRENDIDEWSLRKKDGTYLPVEVSAKILADGRWQGFVRDLSKQKAAEKKFSFLFESAPDAQVIVNIEGEIQLANQQCEKVLGYRKEELIGQKVEILVPEKFRKEHPAHRDKLISEAKSRRMGLGKKLYARKKDGSELPVDILISPVRIDGDVLVLAVLRDLSELKKLAAYSRNIAEVRENLNL